MKIEDPSSQIVDIKAQVIIKMKPKMNQDLTKSYHHYKLEHF